MKRFVLTWVAICCLPPALGAQSRPGQQRVDLPTITIDSRVLRENAVHHAGKAARPLVESDLGDEASRALLNCTHHTASRLIEFNASGGLSQLAMPKELLLSIAGERSGNDIACYVMNHCSELSDREYCKVFLASPADFASQRKILSDAVQERRNDPFSFHWLADPSSVPDKAQFWALGIGLIGLIVLLIWKVRQVKARNSFA